MKRIRKVTLAKLVTLFMISTFISCGVRTSEQADLKQYRQSRLAKLDRPHAVIHNNDGNDAYMFPEKPYERWSKLKAAHPEFLFGACGEKFPHGRWSAVDFSHAEIRDLCVQYCTEVCRNYDVDGIELDFFRHLYLFKNVARGETAGTAQLGLITDMVKKIREMTEKRGMEKGKPILVTARIPDSMEYCRAVGIDIESWIEQGLIDIVVASDYFRLNPWRYLVDRRHTGDVKMYAGLSEPRINGEHPLLKRRQNAVYCARSAAA